MRETITAGLILVIVGVPEFSFAIILYDFSGDFSRLKQKIACKILFEEEQQALRQSGEEHKPLAKFALLRRDGLFVLQFFRYYEYNN